jgi:hypothetical protein
MNSYIDKLFGK